VLGQLGRCGVLRCAVLCPAGALLKEFSNGVMEGNMPPDASLSHDGRYVLSGKVGQGEVLTCCTRQAAQPSTRALFWLDTLSTADQYTA
jgi:hypothetical protein